MPQKKSKETEKTRIKAGEAGAQAGMQEKKEKFLDGAVAAKDAKAGSNAPAYLLAMILILGIVAGAALMITLIKPPPIPQGDDQNATNDSVYRTVPITVVYSAECKSCRETNTIEELFKVRNIPYTMQKVEASSEEGKRIIERFGITNVPTAIIDAQKMEFYPTTKKNFDAVLDKRNSAYIAEELNLNENYYFPVYFLEEVPGFCSSRDKPAVVQFDDYYAPQNTDGKKAFYNFTKDFNGTTSIKYSFAQSVSRDDNSIIGNVFLMCASEQGKYLELEEKISAMYCNNPFKGDPTILTDSEIAGCRSLSPHYGRPLTQIELDIALGRTGLDKNKFVQCVKGKDVLLNNAKKTWEELGITRTGTFLLDCRETSSLAGLRDSFCSRHPKNDKCPAKSSLKA